MSAREEIAAAASAVEGFEISPDFRQVSKPGQGYVTFLRTEYPNRFGGEDYWGVMVFVPQDLAAAQNWIAANKAGLVEGLRSSRAMTVTAARPERVDQPDNPIIKMLVIEGHRESEE